MASGWEQVGKLKKELQAEQAEHAKNRQQLKDLQTANEGLQKTLTDEQSSRINEQQRTKDLSSTTDKLRAEVMRAQDRLATAEQAETALKELQEEATDLRQQASEGNSRLRKELQAEQAERARDWQQLKDLQIANEELQRTVTSERQGRAMDQQQIKELIVATDALRADGERRQDHVGGNFDDMEMALRALQAEAVELRKQASEANMWKARAAALESPDCIVAGDNIFGRTEPEPGSERDLDSPSGAETIGRLNLLTVPTPQTVEALQVRVKELERQLARAERTVVQLQDASGGSWKRVMEGVGGIICSAYRCLRAAAGTSHQGYMVTPQESHGDLEKYPAPYGQT